MGYPLWPGWIYRLDLLLRQQKAKQLEEVEAGLSVGREGMGCYPLVSCSIAIMWVKLCYKPPIFLGMVTIPPIKMVIAEGWFMTLFYIAIDELIADKRFSDLPKWWCSTAQINRRIIPPFPTLSANKMTINNSISQRNRVQMKNLGTPQFFCQMVPSE